MVDLERSFRFGPEWETMAGSGAPAASYVCGTRHGCGVAECSAATSDLMALTAF